MTLSLDWLYSKIGSIRVGRVKGLDKNPEDIDLRRSFVLGVPPVEVQDPWSGLYQFTP